MEVGETLRVESVEAWRHWLVDHHADRREAWLILDHKGPGRRTPDYEDLLDEAVCHGWVDGMIRGRDASSYLMRWTPRRPGSNWTAVNRDRARRLAGAGRLTVAGLLSLPADLRAEIAAAGSETDRLDSM